MARPAPHRLRHGRVYREGGTWTAYHLAWIDAQRFDVERLEGLPRHHRAVLDARLAQRATLDAEISLLARSEPYAPVVRAMAAAAWSHAAAYAASAGCGR